MNVAYLVLYVLAAVFFAGATLGVSSRLNLVALGLYAWVLVPLLHAVAALNR